VIFNAFSALNLQYLLAYRLAYREV